MTPHLIWIISLTVLLIIIHVLRPQKRAKLLKSEKDSGKGLPVFGIIQMLLVVVSTLITFVAFFFILTDDSTWPLNLWLLGALLALYNFPAVSADLTASLRHSRQTPAPGSSPPLSSETTSTLSEPKLDSFKIILAEIPDTRLSDVVLSEETKVEIKEIISHFKNPSKNSYYGTEPFHGVLLYGPEGCGKTECARAIAGEAGVPFYAYAGSDFVNIYVGAGAASVRKRVEEAKKNTPCIVFIDEIDAVAKKRVGGPSAGTHEHDQTLNQLLVAMDGFIKTPGILFIVATNREDLLDPAFKRPGRMDKKVLIDKPDVGLRKEILEIHSRNKPLSPEVDIQLVAKRTPDFSGADLKCMLNEAALQNERRGEKGVITNQDLEYARLKVISGTGGLLSLSAEERLVVAFHEAGHTLIALLIQGAKDPVDMVSIVSRGKSLGFTLQMPEFERRLYSREYLLNKISVWFGGREAEELVFGYLEVTSGGHNDLEMAIETAHKMVAELGMSELGSTLFERTNLARWEQRGSEDQAKAVETARKKIIDETRTKARSILKREKTTLEILACALLFKETLYRRDLELLISQGKEGLRQLLNGGSLEIPNESKKYFSDGLPV